MTPKQQVALMIGVFSALGIGVSVGIIAAGGGFAGGPLLSPPTESDIYVVGTQVRDGDQYRYTLTSIGPNSSLVDADVRMSFERQGEAWRASFAIVNGTGTASNFDMMFSSHLTRMGPMEPQIIPFLEPIETSIFAVRDMEYGGREKYLAIGAPWNTIFYSTTSATVRITGQETVQTQAGAFDSFILGYRIGERTSDTWIVRDLPFPVKAEVYDPAGELLYQYELVDLRRTIG